MRKHGWQLPYHPLQVVAVAVFLALGFAFYVFFAPFVGKKLYQYIIMGVYTPLILSAFGLYIWCAASDPADSGVFKSKKYLKTSCKEHTKAKDSKLGGGSASSKKFTKASENGGKPQDGDVMSTNANLDDVGVHQEQTAKTSICSCISGVLFFPCIFLYNCMSSSKDSLERQTSEDGMFYCSLCEVEVFKYSKHCRVCDKCVDRFDHHCRWLNNCIGKRNYRKFFTLMVVALLLLILQWSTGILVLICSFLEKTRFSAEIVAKLGSSFSLVPFIIVVSVCTILAMIATLPLVQLFFFHILLIKKGLTTYDYIVALREQEQQELGGGQSPQMSQVSSLTGLSSASSFNNFRRGAWCTPPRLFLEDQFDVVPPDTGSVSSYGKKAALEEPIKKKNGAVKISPWTLARLNAEEVSKAAAEARKKSKILQPVIRREGPLKFERDSSFGSGRHMASKIDHNRRRNSKRVRLPSDLPLEQLVNVPTKTTKASSINLAPLQLEARSAFRTSLAMSSGANMVGSSPESSLGSPDVHPFRLSSSGAEESRRINSLSLAGAVALPEIPLSRSTSDGYEPSGGEDSDQVPSRTVNWSSLLFRSNQDGSSGFN
ncbi:probable protein S-acyltransferase 22 [Amaranthus tricolor]|uniref:probable protein S-acyltransferase 22 n=1 Tax=Amaranthus tricolor TaxID=29722 RepID=UPI00258A67FC|nr:probable protein S-acyltransferase 22 [Amaranthus tricolor]